VNYRWEHWIGFIVWLVSFFFIHNQTSKRFPERDPYIIPIAALLSGWGLLTIWRLDITFGIRQTIWLLIAQLVFWIGLKYPVLISLLRRYKYIWLICGLFLTILTLFLGTYPGGVGPNLWLNFGGIFLQPSEPLKLLLIVFLSAYLADRIPMRLHIFKLLTPTFILIGAALVILVAQRDLGTVSIVVLLYFIILFIASSRRLTLLIAAMILIAAGFIGYQLFDVIHLRIDTWLNPMIDPSGQSYQIIQSLLAVASGGFVGRGFGLGVPGVVPVAHSDFIFSAISEETGLLGTIGFITLYAMLTIRGLIISIQASNNYKRFLAAGLTSYFIVQSMVIIAGNLNMLPLTGVTLPLVSYGGSSLLTSFIAILILCLVSDQTEKKPANLSQMHGKSFQLVGIMFLTGLVLVAIFNGWWAIIRSTELTTRADNPRQAITDYYIPRGNFLDRNNQALTETSGEIGNYTHLIVHPPLSPIIGYSDLFYGQSGLEESMDSYLRGRKGNPSFLIWSNYLVYGQRPQGLDIRLSLDLELQRKADELLADHNGTVILLNAQSGEILVMTSHPYFDSNLLEENWELWNADEDAPFLNRATQGQYLPGTSIGPFLLTALIEEDALPPIPDKINLAYQNQEWECAIEPSDPSNWGHLVANGCPGAIASLGHQLGTEKLIQLFEQMGFDKEPVIPLPTAEAAELKITQMEQAVVGQDAIKISPLQMALASAALSARGSLPAPSLDIAVHTSHQGWVVLPHDEPKPAITPSASYEIVSLLSMPGSFIWQSTSTAFDEKDQKLTWYLAGTNYDWQGSPLAMVILLEEDNPDLATRIGVTLLSATMTP
jgi:cell division protein FtsW (lipid II flippase)